MSIRKVQFNKMSLADKNYYQENGCILVNGLYSANEIKAALDAVWQELYRIGEDYENTAENQKIFAIHPNFSKSAAEWNLYRNSSLLEVNNLLTDWDEVFWNDTIGTLLISWPQENDWVGLHLDFGVERHKISPDEQLTYMMIYLTDADSEQYGRTKVVPGSHKIVREHLLQNPDDPRNKVLYDDVEFFGFENIIPVNVKAGDVLIFDYLLAHSAGGQRKPTPRVTLRTGFHNGKGDLANQIVQVPPPIYSKLNPVERQLAGRSS